MRIFERTGAARPADVASADLELAESLESLDDADNYADWIFSLMEPHLGPRVVEVGAGHGTFTELLAKSEREVVVQDISDRCVAMLDERFSQRPNVHVSSADLEGLMAEGPFDSAVLINVLEHIPDDQQAIGQLANLLVPGGRLFLWVPAFQALYADFDRRVGHFRRYRRSTLCSQLQSAGLRVVEARYANLVGGMAWLLYARMLRGTPTSGRSVRIFDRLVPTLSRIERTVKVPFGQSVYVVAEKEYALSEKEPS